MPDLVNAVTGWNTTTFELMKVGERAVTMARAFNIREGFTIGDDFLPDRFSSPLNKGPIAGESVSKEELEKSIKTYYTMMGWEAENGVPTTEKLFELDIGWIAKILR
jgi:aldehyde:ferredoxin oxidoreductase